jgi:PPOX class probable F420-dependent enzyme
MIKHRPRAPMITLRWFVVALPGVDAWQTHHTPGKAAQRSVDLIVAVRNRRRQAIVAGMRAYPSGVAAGMSDEALRKLIGDRDIGVLVTLMPDGRPHVSTITYEVDEPVSLIRVSITDGRVKTRNVQRDGRVSLHVSSADGWSWAAAEGTAELSPVAQDRHDATVEELIEVYRNIAGEHPDWDDYRRAMVEDERLVLRLRVRRLYGHVN